MKAAAGEEAVQFGDPGRRLFGILHRAGAGDIRDLVVMVVGGPQTRAGCHRAYVDIARDLCVRGFDVFRFDYAGLGDSEGPFVGYEYAAPSLRLALDFVGSSLPSVRNVYLWSLCDGSAACAVYSRFDRDRITGMLLCNPFVRSEESKAKTYLRHYYLWRILQKDFFLKLLKFDLDLRESARSLLALVRQARSRGAPAAAAAEVPPERRGCFLEAEVRTEVVRGIAGFGKPVHFLLSTNDFVAKEFRELVVSAPETASLVAKKKICLEAVNGADHTFSKSSYRREVCGLTSMALIRMGAQPRARSKEGRT